MVIFPKYESYKDSEFDWLGEIPSHWSLRKLKYIAKVRLSNVDKHSKLRETPIKLCNYTDVYYQDFITDDIDFMAATATANQISDFILEHGDVLITKDSESFDDIAVPAYVPISFNDVICGYHLAHIKPICIEGSYLFRAFQAESIASQFKISANGITRYGIGKSAINNALFIVPPIEEQHRIVEFLDHKTAEIDQAIAQKQRLIELLQEQKAILINQAVTKGLKSNAPMRYSGVDWIGQIPEHWEIRRAKYLFREIDERSKTGYEELLSVSHITGVTPRSEKNVNMFLAEDYSGSKLCHKDDLVINIMWAWMGALGVSKQTGIVSPSYGVFRQLKTKIFNSWYLEHLLRSIEYIAQYNRISTGLHSSRLRLYADMFLNMEILLPPKDEQDQIEAIATDQTKEIDTAIKAIEREIEVIKELRSILISQAVTGKINVLGKLYG
jgi:type I restriction enzyme, S subunit